MEQGEEDSLSWSNYLEYLFGYLLRSRYSLLISDAYSQRSRYGIELYANVEALSKEIFNFGRKTTVITHLKALTGAISKNNFKIK
jgi:hypothetical protein